MEVVTVRYENGACHLNECRDIDVEVSVAFSGGKLKKKTFFDCAHYVDIHGA
jgi:hypothetical protein